MPLLMLISLPVYPLQKGIYNQEIVKILEAFPRLSENTVQKQ